MTIYEHRTSLTTAAGSVASVALRCPGGLARQVLIRANTSTTLFRADLTDENGLVRLNYDFHNGEINDTNICFPVNGAYTLNITNASPNDVFNILFAVQEN